ncbi:beta-ketoacyl synthase N-terminal-like domain-containing protein, partial [Streptomyces anulatus]|uniref:beta-ketoacyl synthase N-terminal-like domain-containing protein n=1 Tax=Streptomyces anulatus TaxID=1892 RepID=UPI0036AAD3C0
MSAATGRSYRRAPLAPFAAAVTGVGLVTAAGTGADAAWHGVTEGLVPAVGPRPELDGLPCDFFYSVTDCDPAAVLGVAAQRLMDRFAQLAVIAAREAVADAGLDPALRGSGRVGGGLGYRHSG